MRINFSAFDILINRTDLGKVLIDKSIALSAKKLDNETELKKGEHSVKLSFRELISGQLTVDKNSSSNEIYYLITALVTSYHTKKLFPEIYGTLSLSSCAFAINKLMFANNASEKFISNGRLIEEGNIFSQEVLDSILGKAQIYIKK